MSTKRQSHQTSARGQLTRTVILSTKIVDDGWHIKGRKTLSIKQNKKGYVLNQRNKERNENQKHKPKEMNATNRNEKEQNRNKNENKNDKNKKGKKESKINKEE